MGLWYEYPIPADTGKQKEIIRKLRKWIQSLESRGIIEGFAFNHYYPEPAILNIRFDSADPKKLEIARNELEKEVRQFVPDYNAGKSERLWDEGKTQEHIYKAYEFGSRCAFLAWELIENKRFPEEYFSDFHKRESEKGIIVEKIPYEFQHHSNHGLMNSLKISKTPNELLIHLNLLMDCTKSRTKQELINWLQKNLKAPQQNYTN